MRQSFIYLIISLLLLEFANGEELIITGKYKGQNVYIHNPYAADKISSCVQQIEVNGQKVWFKRKNSAFVIDMSFLKEGVPVEIKINYLEGCMLPKIMNPEAIFLDEDFRFITVDASDSTIRWSVYGAYLDGDFKVLKKIENVWKPIWPQNSDTILHDSTYVLSCKHKKGVNDYKILFQDKRGYRFYSDLFQYHLMREDVHFFPLQVIDHIRLSRKAEYEILNGQYIPIAKGEADIIKLKSLPAGLYYIKLEDQEAKEFIKK